MILTVEDVTAREKRLSDFIPFVEIAIQVEQLPFHYQIAFFCSCAERIIPVYTLLDGCDDLCDISDLELVISDLWKIAGGMDIEELEVESLVGEISSSLEEYEYNYSETDDCTEIQKHIICLAIYVSDFLDQIVEYATIVSLSQDSSTKRTDLFLKIFVTVVFTIYEHLDVLFYNMNPLWELQSSRKEQDLLLIEHSLTKLEIQKEITDVDLLSNTQDLNSEILSSLRNSACPRGSSILGAVDEVKRFFTTAKIA